MPDKIFDILKCSINEDQFNVATQWANTFIHNPIDTANNMTQLVMACVARGDFKTRAYMSKSNELQAPSDQLTIADYLSHASRIIIDYHFLSDANAQELLNYFPGSSETNTVMARSATHNVYQVNEKITEGKGLLIGVAGQLPSLIKTPRDFGINIAMGGVGQNNFYGKQISANGFSGHFYYHRNTEHRLLLAGLEQTAPSASALELLRGSEQYDEKEQQGHDQFGQGHSLTGASDTYTAAGSLYFSHPVYQAKLLLEKGVFPPDKYGAMQVTITDENWPFIKEFLMKLQASVGDGNKAEMLGYLLGKPSTAENTKAEYLSFIALDFNTYLKQVYKVFIDESDLGGDEKSAFAKMQMLLLASIKKLQVGNIEAYNEFDTVLAQILSTENIPAEYNRSLLRISELFKLQLNVDPQLKNTHVNRQYQFGDLTWCMLSKIHQKINGTQNEDQSIENPKEYEFGDITWGLLNRIANSKKEYQFGDLTWGFLSQINQVVNSNEEYQFGDISRGLLSRMYQSIPEITTQQNTTQTTGYGIVNYTRNLIWGASTTDSDVTKNNVTDINEQGSPLDPTTQI